MISGALAKIRAFAQKLLRKLKRRQERTTALPAGEGAWWVQAHHEEKVEEPERNPAEEVMMWLPVSPKEHFHFD